MSLTSVTSPAAAGHVTARSRVPPALRAYQYNLLAYKRTWRGSLTTTFLYPVLYLAAIGVGLGHLIDHGSNQAVDGVPVHLVPRARAAGGNGDADRGERVDLPGHGGDQVAQDLPRDARHAARGDRRPLRPPAVDHDPSRHWRRVSSLASWRHFTPCLPAWAVAAFPAAVLTGAAFAAPVMAFSATPGDRRVLHRPLPLRHRAALPVLGDLLPVAQLPGWLQVVARCTPLYQGVSLCRGFVLGRPGGWDALGHAGYLLVCWPPACSPPRVTLSPEAGAMRRTRRHRPLVGRRAGRTVGEAGQPVARADGPGTLLVTDQRSGARCRSGRPPVGIGRGRARHLVERNVVAYRRGWIFLVSGFFEPFFYLLVDRARTEPSRRAISTIGGHSIPYTDYVAPGLLASSAMNGADLRRHVRDLLQAQDREDLRRHPGDAARRPRRGDR